MLILSLKDVHNTSFLINIRKTLKFPCQGISVNDIANLQIIFVFARDSGKFFCCCLILLHLGVLA